MQKLAKASAGLALVLFGGSASAHTRWKVDGLIKPRTTDGDTPNTANVPDGIKQGPCGTLDATTDPTKRTELTAGQQITVQWEETVEHHGYFKVNFSAKNDINWTALSAEIPDLSTDKGLHSTQITVPGENCANCTLQITQFMSNDMGGGSFYFNCADIKITGGTPEATTSDPDTATASDTATSTDGAATDSTSDTATGDDDAAAPEAPTGLKVDVKKPKGGK
jgi:hypothetical protein